MFPSNKSISSRVYVRHTNMDEGSVVRSKTEYLTDDSWESASDETYETDHTAATSYSSATNRSCRKAAGPQRHPFEHVTAALKSKCLDYQLKRQSDSLRESVAALADRCHQLDTLLADPPQGHLNELAFEAFEIRCVHSQLEMRLASLRHSVAVLNKKGVQLRSLVGEFDCEADRLATVSEEFYQRIVESDSSAETTGSCSTAAKPAEVARDEAVDESVDVKQLSNGQSMEKPSVSQQCHQPSKEDMEKPSTGQQCHRPSKQGTEKSSVSQQCHQPSKEDMEKPSTSQHCHQPSKQGTEKSSMSQQCHQPSKEDMEKPSTSQQCHRPSEQGTEKSSMSQHCHQPSKATSANQQRCQPLDSSSQSHVPSDLDRKSIFLTKVSPVDFHVAPFAGDADFRSPRQFVEQFETTYGLLPDENPHKARIFRKLLTVDEAIKHEPADTSYASLRAGFVSRHWNAACQSRVYLKFSISRFDGLQFPAFADYICYWVEQLRGITVIEEPQLIRTVIRKLPRELREKFVDQEPKTLEELRELCLRELEL